MENISKVVVTKNDGAVLGYVLNIVLEDFVKIGYVVVDEETENEYLLKRENVLSTSQDFLLIEEASVLEFLSQGQPSILGLEVLDEKGFSYGRVSGLKFEKNKCQKIITEKCEILTKYIKKIGKNFIFINFKKKRNKIFKNEFPKTNNFEMKVEIQNVQPIEKISLSSQAYVGKVCLRDIFGYNNERIVQKGSVVTKAVVEKAKQHDRLNQLFFALKRD